MTKDLHLYEFTLSFPKDPFLSKKSPALIGLLVRVQIVHRQRFSLISLTYQILFCCAVKHAEIILEKKKRITNPEFVRNGQADSKIIKC